MNRTISISLLCFSLNLFSAIENVDKISAEKIIYLVPMVHAGFGTPYGILGAGLEIQGQKWIALDLGAGMGMSTKKVQLAVMPRVTWNVFSDFFVDFGVGLSAGAYQGKPLNLAMENTYYDPKQHWERAIWLNGEVSGGWHFS